MWQRVAVCAFAVALVSCAPITIKDSVPPGMPRGFVEFYVPNTDKLGYQPAVCRLEEGSCVHEGWLSANDVTGTKTGLRLGKPPGNYEFLVQIGNASQPAFVEIVENEVTPVRIVFSTVRESSIQNQISFDMAVSVEEPVPLSRWR